MNAVSVLKLNHQHELSGAIHFVDSSLAQSPKVFRTGSEISSPPIPLLGWCQLTCGAIGPHCDLPGASCCAYAHVRQQLLAPPPVQLHLQNVQPLHWSSAIRHPCKGSYNAPHIHNTASATFLHGGVVVRKARDMFGSIGSRGSGTPSGDTLTVALAYYSSSSSCRHISHSVLVQSDGRTAVFGEFCLMYTHLSARSRAKRLCPLL
jgi:hypothetical protein